MNDIPQEQSATLQLERLAAQRELYTKAKQVQKLQLVLAVPAVIVWALAAALFPALGLYAAAWGIMVSLLDLAVLSPKQQELFDCDVLHLDWRDYKVGPRPEPELVSQYSSLYRRSDATYTQLRGWYPSVVGEVPLYQGRIICQRANCWWDAHLRRRYASCVLVVLVAVTLLVFLIGLIGGLTVEKFVLAVLTPLLPAFVLAISQYRGQRSAANTVDRLREHAEDIFRDSLSAPSRLRSGADRSRELQDAIFDHRRGSPLILDSIYQRFRGSQEEQMNEGAAAMVAEARR